MAAEEGEIDGSIGGLRGLIRRNMSMDSINRIVKLRETKLWNGPNEEDDKSEELKREWNNKLDFLMSCVSFAVGLGNVWRFPFKVFNNGGGTFIIAYLICWLIIGIPMFFFETAMGQYTRAGGIGVWRVMPMFKGVGIAGLTAASLISIYYAVVVAWSFLYLFTSMQRTLPWATCGHVWNSENCVDFGSTSNVTNASYPVQDYWERFILQLTDGIEDAGSIQWYLVATLLLSWILVFLIIWRGLHSAGKIIWFTALFPYVIIFIFLGKVLSLDGAEDGIQLYLQPNITKLKEPQVWMDAAVQIVYSYGIGVSTLFALGCYNTYHHNCQRDAVIIGLINSGTSIVAGFVVFGALGFMAKKAQKTVSEIAQDGPGLVFQTYPQLFLEMPFPPIWSVMFFMMVILLGIDSLFCMVEGVVAGLEDQFSSALSTRRTLLTLGICFLFFLLGLPMVTGGGYYLFNLMDNMAASVYSLLWIVFWEVFTVTYFFDFKRFYHGLFDMIGHKVKLRYYFVWWAACWTVLIPVFSIIIFIYSLVAYTPLTLGAYTYPAWSQVLGWLMTLSSMLFVPGYALFFLVTTPGTLKQKFKTGITAKIDLRNETAMKREQDADAQSVCTLQSYKRRGHTVSSGDVAKRILRGPSSGSAKNRVNPVSSQVIPEESNSPVTFHQEQIKV